jgi:phytoene desaturase
MTNPTAKKAVIIGAGLGSLSTAIHLRLKGLDVSVYESNSHTGGRANIIERSGFSFDTGPSLLNYPWVFEDLFQSAGKSFYDYVTLLKVDPSVSFLWPDRAHFSLSSDLHRLITECERLEPDSGPGLFKFLLDTSKRYKLSFSQLVTKNADSYFEWIKGVGISDILSLGVTRSFYSDLRRYFKNRYICEALGSYGMYLGGSPYDLPGIFSILPFGELAYGLSLPKGGIYSLVRSIERLARELGVQIHINSLVSQIVVNDKKVTGIKLDSGQFIESSIVISNVDVPTTYSTLLAQADLSAISFFKKSKLKMTPSVLTFYWGIKGKIPNLPHHTIFLPSDYKQAFKELMREGKVPDELPFYCSVPSETDPELAPSGDSTMFVLVPLPVLSKLGKVDWQQFSAKIKEQVLNRLKLHHFEISQEQISVEEIFTPVDWQQKFGLYDGSAFGAAHTLFQMGPMRPKNYDQNIKGLFFVGASTTPGTGMPMVVLGGKMTAERILQHVH